MISSSKMHWKGCDLYLGRRRVGSVVPDSKYPNMWRARRSDGSLTDMANLSRAKDAAMSIAVAEFKQETKARTASPMR